MNSGEVSKFRKIRFQKFARCLKNNWMMENEGIIRYLEINEWKNNNWDFTCDLSCVCL